MGVKLTKRNYLGDGYHHEFVHVITGEHVFIPCTEKEYAQLGEKNIQPELEGYTWIGSTGGTYKVDTIDGRLGVNEYCDINADEVIARIKSDRDKEASWVRLPKTEIVDDEIKPKGTWQLP